MTANLNAQGYTDEDIKRIMFNAYEDLMGETESRSVQHSMMVDAKYSNYFFLYNWENAPDRKVAVINDEYIDIDTRKIEAAVESTPDGYIMHFKKVYDVQPFIHELGHIVHDILVNDGFGDRIDAEYAKSVTSILIERSTIVKLYRNIEFKNNQEINEILDYMFSVNAEASDYTKFLKHVILEIESDKQD